MNLKLVSAFATGAILASGIVYFAVRPDDTPKKVDPPRARVVAKAVAPLPPVETAPAPAPVEPAIPEAPPRPARVHQTPVWHKPSPMPPPLRSHNEVALVRPPVQTVPPITHDDPPPAAPAEPPQPVASPAPVPSPVPATAAPLPLENVSLPATPSEIRVPHTVTLAAGTLLPVRIGETLSSAHNQTGDGFLATLTQPLVIDGFIIAERGARVEGRVVNATQAGRVNGLSHLEISIVRLSTDDGQNIRIRTEPFVKDGASSTGADVAKVGGGAALGAIIGAAAGGGKGAAIGAGVGGAAGVGSVLLSRSKSVEIAVESRVSFRVQDPVTITERLD